MNDNSTKTVLIFGVFDMLHPGHVYFINESMKYGESLHVCLATDEYVLKYKNKKTKNDYKNRELELKKAFPDIKIIKGDDDIGDWSVFKNLNPDVFVFGYDQKELARAIGALSFSEDVETFYVDGWKPELYNTTNLSV